MLPLGVFGWWNPWRGPPDIRPLGTAPVTALKLLVVGAIAVLVVL